MADLIGQEGAERLLEDGHSVVAFDLPNPRNQREARRFAGRVKTVWGDIRSPDDIGPCVEESDAIIHDAGVLAPASENHPDLAYAVNVGGTNFMNYEDFGMPAQCIVWRPGSESNKKFQGSNIGNRTQITKITEKRI